MPESIPETTRPAAPDASGATPFSGAAIEVPRDAAKRRRGGGLRLLGKAVAAAAVLASVGAVSYAAGAAKAKQWITLPFAEINWEPYEPGSPLQVAKLWGDRAKGGEYGMLMKMPGGFESGMHTHSLDYHAILVQGTWVHAVEGDMAIRDLSPGSYVFQPGRQNHNDVCKSRADCIYLMYQRGKGDYKPAKLAATDGAGGTTAAGAAGASGAAK